MKNLEELKKELATAKAERESAKDPDEIEFADAEVSRIEEEIAAVENGGAVKEKKTRKKREPKKDKTPRSKKAKIAVTHAGKTYNEDDPEFLTAAKQGIKDRREKYKTGGKKHKTSSVSQRIGADLGGAIKAAIDNIEPAQIKKNPSLTVKQLVKLRKSFTELMLKFKSILGDDFDGAEIRDGLKLIDEAISKIQKTKK